MEIKDNIIDRERKIEMSRKRKNLLSNVCTMQRVERQYFTAAFNIALMNWSAWPLSIQEPTLSVQEGNMIVWRRSHYEKNRSSQLHVRARNNRARSPTCYLQDRQSSNRMSRYREDARSLSSRRRSKILRERVLYIDGCQQKKSPLNVDNIWEKDYLNKNS